MGDNYVLRLIVAGASPNSTRAIANIKEICEAHLKDRYTLEIIDIYQQTALAKEQAIVALPLLVKRAPLPERKLIGDLSQTAKVLKILGLTG